MRIIFMGSPEFAVPTLQALVDAAHEVVCVYTQPPRPGGRRGKELTQTAVHQLAERLGIEVRHPVSLKSAEEQEKFAALGADVAVVAAYGLILPQAVLDAPKHGCLNVHASILPHWRGAAPIHRSIMAGDEVTGVTIMQMEAGLDTGPMLATVRTPVDDKTTGELTEELAELGAQLMVGTLIDLDGVRVKLLRAEIVAGSGKPGEVLDDTLAIACGSGAIRPVELQKAGKPRMNLDTFLRGNPVAKGMILS